MKFIKKDENEFGADWLRSNIYKTTSTIEKEINQYITLKLVGGRTYIYVNGKKFIQCIRLILNIPKEDVPLYDEIDSIDEAAKLYSTHIHQNRIIRGPIVTRGQIYTHNITPEQEFWGHCSNIQAWVEHDYDTRILMSNISFPLLRELTIAGDSKGRRIYKEEIAQRLESGYPSVVQYLLTQGYIEAFSPNEFQTILESTDLIKKLSSEPNILFQFLRSCISKFPTLLEDILLQILTLTDGKKILFSSIQIKPKISPLRPFLRYPQFLCALKTALENLYNRVDERKIGEDIIACIQVINNKFEGQDINNMFLNGLNEEQKLLFRHKIFEQIRRTISKCPYCRKIMPKGQDICDWCGHKKDDDEGGFFPYLYIFKPPGGGGGSKKGMIAVPVIIYP